MSQHLDSEYPEPALDLSGDSLGKRAVVKQTAIGMVERKGLINLSRRDLCAAAGIADGSFPHVMGCNFAQFVEELKQENIREEAHAVVNKSRANPELRRLQILTVAVGMAKTQGYPNITRDKIAENAGVSMGLVTRYFGTMCQLRRCIVRHAIKYEIPEIVAQALAVKDPHAKNASDKLKALAAQIIVGG